MWGLTKAVLVMNSSVTRAWLDLKLVPLIILRSKKLNDSWPPILPYLAVRVGLELF